MAFPEDTIMTKDQKIIRAKAGVLELANSWQCFASLQNDGL